MKRAWLIHAVTAALVVRNAIESTRADLWSWSHWLISRRDFFFIWGYKARLIATEHTLPMRFLASLPNDFSHPDYPLLIPLLFAPLPLPWIGIVNALFAALLLVIVHSCLRREFDPTFAALGTLALAGAALTPWPGFADGPLILFAAGAALLFRADRDALGATLLALAVLTKNEGAAFVVSITAALLLYRRKQLRNVIPAAFVIAIWTAVKIAFHLRTDLFTSGIAARIAANAPHFFAAFATVPVFQPWLWIASIVALAVAPRRDRFLLTTAAIQLAFYLGAYLITPLDLAGHVNGSWERISSHVTMLVAFAAVVSIGERFKR